MSVGTSGSGRPGRTRSVWAAWVVVIGVCLSACSTGAVGAPVPTTTSSPTGGIARGPAGTSPALQLVPAIWRVRDAAGESQDTWIRFDDSIDLIRPKGDVYLEWAAQGDALLAHVGGWSMTLGSTPPPVPWLTATTGFAKSGDGWVLTDADGRRTARLVRDGVPPPSTQTLHTVPTVDPFLRRQRADAVAGADVHSIPPAAAVGTWGLSGVATSDGSITFTREGTWTSKSSCEVLGDANGGGGAYRLLPTGFVLATEGGIAGVGCATPATAPPGDALAILDFFSAGSMAISRSRMTVYDRTGKRLGTLERKK